MDFNDSAPLPAIGIAAGDPLPPDDWRGPVACVATAAATTATTAATAATAVYSTHQPRLARFMRGRAPAQDVGDLVQECFRRVLASGAYPRVLAEQPGAYLFRTARNLLAERMRTGERRMAADHESFEEPDIAGPDPHDALEARDAIRQVENALARLNPKTQDIFLMHRFDGLSYEEIAAAKGMSVKGVEKQIAKAMIAIRRARTARP